MENKTIYVCEAEKEDGKYIACIEDDGRVWLDGRPIQAFDNLKAISQEAFYDRLASLPRDVADTYIIQGFECDVKVDIPPKEICSQDFTKLPSELEIGIMQIMQE